MAEQGFTLTNYDMEIEKLTAVGVKESSRSWPKLCFVCVILLLASVCIVVIVALAGSRGSPQSPQFFCGTTDVFKTELMCRGPESLFCNVTLVESVPENLTFFKNSPVHPSVFDGWMELLDFAESSIYIASSYWTLRADDLPVKDPSSWQGQKIFDRLVEAGQRG